jgi:hypothetical protein
MRLFGRAWSVTIDRLEVSGHDMAFEVEKSLKPDPNTCELRLWNLNESQRSQLEELRPKKGSLVGIPVKIEAGYEAASSLIWLGDLRTVESNREGPDWITVLGSGDGEKSVQLARINQSFDKLTSVDTILRSIAKAMGVGPGNLEFFAQRLLLTGQGGKLATEGVVLSGRAADKLTAWCRSLDIEWSVQDGALQFTDRGKPLIGQAFLLSAETGLIGTPTVDNEGVLSATMLMIPGLVVGSLLVLNSRRIKGNYRVRKAKWDGDTSGQPWYIHVEAERF